VWNEMGDTGKQSAQNRLFGQIKELVILGDGKYY
jgi:hypothetical protein